MLRICGFGLDEWIEGVTLALTFPRMFALAMNKNGKIVKFGS